MEMVTIGDNNYGVGSTAGRDDGTSSHEKVVLGRGRRRVVGGRWAQGRATGSLRSTDIIVLYARVVPFAKFILSSALIFFFPIHCRDRCCRVMFRQIPSTQTYPST